MKDAMNMDAKTDETVGPQFSGDRGPAVFSPERVEDGTTSKATTILSTILRVPETTVLDSGGGGYIKP